MCCGGLIWATDVDLRERTEGTLPGDTDLVAALDLALDLAFDGQAAAERGGQLGLVGRRAADRPYATAPGRRRSRPPWPRGCARRAATSTLPSSSFSSAISIVASPLPPMSTNANSGPNGDDRAFDRLSHLDPPGLGRRLEHRKAKIIFLWIAHCLLLGTGTSVNYMGRGGGPARAPARLA